jgi:ABC-2 type transport system ATP-binding protein
MNRSKKMNDLIVENVSKIIHNNIILNKINLSLDEGKIYGLYGPNGSGKTMLIRTMSGLMKPTSGFVRYKNHVLYDEFDFMPNIGLIIENISLYDEFSGYKNLVLLAKIRKRCTNETIEKYMKEFGLSPDDKKIVKKYSLGMKQKLSIIQAFMEKPSVLLLDEPTNALDTSSVNRFVGLCKSAAEENAIVIIASHDKELIQNLCDVTYYMNAGEITEMVVKL